MMGGTAPDINGKFISMRTGNTIFAHGCIMDGDRVLVNTDLGVLPMSEFSNEYIQMDEKVYDENGRELSSEAIKERQERDRKRIAEQKIKDAKLSKAFEGIDTTPKKQQPSTVHKVVVDKSEEVEVVSNSTPSYSDIISKVLDKVPAPVLTTDIIWTDFPTTELSFLTSYLDVPESTILDAIVEKYVNLHELKTSIVESLKIQYFT